MPFTNISLVEWEKGEVQDQDEEDGEDIIEDIL
jgi:hypothetical protein